MMATQADDQRRRSYGPPAQKDGTHIDEGLLVTADEKPRCWRCNGMFAIYLTRPWIVKCRRCRAVNKSPGNPQIPSGAS
jgi:hypothetical protein